jgi:PAS domain S-box-containing protein
MKVDKEGPPKFEELRKRAEDIVGKISEERVGEVSPAEIRSLIHELNVHQIELEMQNEELRRAQEELAKSRDEFANLYDTAPVGYFTLDKQGVILRANPTGVALLGKERRQLTKHPFSVFVTKDDQGIFFSHIRNVFTKSLKQACELRLVRNGGWFHAQLESVPARNSQGQAMQCQTVVLDITERKKAEQVLSTAKDDLERQVKQRTAELEQSNRDLADEMEQREKTDQAIRESEQRFKAIFEGAEDYIFIKDRSLKYTSVNPAAARLLNVPASQLIGLAEEDAFQGRSAAQIREVDTRTLKGDTIQEEVTFTVSGQRVSWLETRIPLRNHSDEPIGICIIAHDISDRKAVEHVPEFIMDCPSQAMRATVRQATLAAKGDITVLLLGESGSGKDYLARYIHDHSHRASGPYFSINCAAVSADLAESELFGHERGSFTGAVGRKRGLLELAEGGTLLLNEIGELSLALQSKLLTFLDTRKFLRVGGEKEISVSARLIAATNRDLGEAVNKGTFRQDLLYRLNVMAITVPPLRERLEDIPILAPKLLSQIRADLQLNEIPTITEQAMKALRAYAWPGNVRELRNVLERAVILGRGKEIGPAQLGLPQVCTPVDDSGSSFTVGFPPEGSVNEVTQNVKRFLVKKALRQSNGRRNRAAKILGISRDSLKHYMKTLGIEDEETEPTGE